MKVILLRGFSNFYLVSEETSEGEVFRVYKRFAKTSKKPAFESKVYNEALGRLIELQEEITTLTPPEGFHCVVLRKEGSFEVMRTVGRRNSELVWVYIVKDTKNETITDYSRSYNVICQKMHIRATEEAVACP